MKLNHTQQMAAVDRLMKRETLKTVADDYGVSAATMGRIFRDYRARTGTPMPSLADTIYKGAKELLESGMSYEQVGKRFDLSGQALMHHFKFDKCALNKKSRQLYID